MGKSDSTHVGVESDTTTRNQSESDSSQNSKFSMTGNTRLAASNDRGRGASLSPQRHSALIGPKKIAARDAIRAEHQSKSAGGEGKRHSDTPYSRPSLKVTTPTGRPEREANRIARLVGQKLAPVRRDVDQQFSDRRTTDIPTTGRSLHHRRSLLFQGASQTVPSRSGLRVDHHHSQSRIAPSITQFDRRGETVGEAPAIVADVISGSGQPLQPSLRQDLEDRFGAGFGDVRVYSGPSADAAARAIDAEAFTVGRSIVFRDGQFDPSTAHGRALLAHELTHVIQQRGGSTEPVVQRAVGFEFESCWEVRDVSGLGETQLAGLIDIAHNYLYEDLAITMFSRNEENIEKLHEWLVKLEGGSSSENADGFIAEKLEQAVEEGKELLRESNGELLPTPEGVSVVKQIIREATNQTWCHWDDPDQFAQYIYLTNTRDLIRSAAKHYKIDKHKAVELLEQTFPRWFAPHPGEKLKRHDVILETPHWSLIADDSPGYPVLEWMTAPHEDRQAMYQTLWEVVQSMVYFSNQPSDYVDVRSLAGYLSEQQVHVTYVRPSLVVKSKPLSLAPQVSAGVSLNAVPALAYADDLGQWSLKSKMKSSYDLADILLDRIDRPIGAFKLHGLLTLVMKYLTGKPSISDAKALAGALMSRTDFVHAYSLLSEEERDRFVQCLTLLKNDEIDFLNQPVFKEPNEAMAAAYQEPIDSDEGDEDTATESGLYSDTDFFPLTLTYADWLDGLVNHNVDLLKSWDGMTETEREYVRSNYGDEADLWKNIESMGHLGVDETERQKNRIVVEFRAFKGSIGPSSVLEKGMEAFDLIKNHYDDSDN